MDRDEMFYVDKGENFEERKEREMQWKSRNVDNVWNISKKGSIIKWILGILWIVAVFFCIYLCFRFFDVCIQDGAHCNHEKILGFVDECPPCTFKILLHLEH